MLDLTSEIDDFSSDKLELDFALEEVNSDKLELDLVVFLSSDKLDEEREWF